MKLYEKTCEVCTAKTPAVSVDTSKLLLEELSDEWSIEDGKLTRSFSFPNFATALAKVNQLGELAESENHHPDLLLSWGAVSVTLYTHSIEGLSENDFILAAKIDQLG